MTTRNSKATNEKRRGSFVLPDPPEGDPEDMTSFDHLAQHLGNPGITIVAGERYLTRTPGSPATDRVAPDILIAFNADPETYRDNNGYIISEQGKPPDFVLEIASRSTGRQDTVEKRAAYAALGIPEYWRFDETGEFHGTRLAGDRLPGGEYEPMPIETVQVVVLQDHSIMLNLLIRWDHGQLGWHDPETGQHIARYEDLHNRAQSEREAREAAENRADTAEARVRDLEEELRRQQP